jgi:hypothetical protein
VNETDRLEALLAGGDEVRLAKRDAHAVVQKLRARGAGGATADRLGSQLAECDEVVLRRGEARRLLAELRASGRRWVFGTDAPRERPAVPERKPEPRPRPWRFFRRNR